MNSNSLSDKLQLTKPTTYCFCNLYKRANELYEKSFAFEDLIENVVQNIYYDFGLHNNSGIVVNVKFLDHFIYSILFYSHLQNQFRQK